MWNRVVLLWFHIDNADSTVKASIYCNKRGRRSVCDRGRSEKTLSLIANIIAKDMLPVSCVEGKGFRQLMAYMEPEYTVPSRKMHTHCICAALDQMEKVALTTDAWTSLALESYVTVTCHYIDEKLEMKSTVLQTRSMPERHSGKSRCSIENSC